MRYTYFDNDMSACEIADEYEWLEIEAMSRVEIIEEICDILTQGRLNRLAEIQALLARLEFSNDVIDELSDMLARESTTELGRIEVCLEVLRKR